MTETPSSRDPGGVHADPAARGASTPAIVGLVVYGLLSAVIGEVWPLSRFAMYAHIPRDAAVPILEVDGRAYPPEDLVDFHGCNPKNIRIPRGVPSRVGWRQDEIARWVTAHGAEEPGDVVTHFGYRMLVIDETGPRLDDTFVELCTGTARWPR